jgi:hypothetical protein
MDKTGYILLAIGIIFVLAAIAIVSFVLYRKTPPPKGCEKLEPDEAICCACLKSGCPYYGEFHKDSAEKKDETNAGTNEKPDEKKGEKK